MARRKPQTDLEPLKVSCTDTNCEVGLHCYRKSRQMAESERGRCRTCGVDLIDWNRVHDRRLADVEFTFESLRTEMVRHHFWHKPVDQRALNYARRKGKRGLRSAILARLTSSVGSAAPYRDGTQTPYEGNIIYYGQHAVACCCRKCIEYWHGIPAGRELTERELNYLSHLVMKYILERLPDLPEVGERVPPIRRTTAN